MKRWIGAGVAVALAVVAALGIGWIRSERQDPAVRDWVGMGEVVTVKGSEFELLRLTEVPYEPLGSSDPVPAGAIVVQADLQQRVLEVSDDEYDLSCTLMLVNGPDAWRPDTDVRFDLDLDPNCHRTSDGPVIVGQERVINAAWVVPASALDGARVELRFGVGEAAAVGFDPGA